MTAVIINFAAWRAARAAATTATPPEPFATPRFWPPRISHPDPKTILIKDTVPQTAIDTSMNGASTLAVNLMHKLALVTLGDLTTVSMEWLLDQPRVGHGTVSRARWALHAYGLEFQGVPGQPRPRVTPMNDLPVLDLPEPPVPPDLDTRDLWWMKLDIGALLNSDFNVLTFDDTAWRAGVTLWCRAWHQVPAGSLPADDRALCWRAWGAI